MTIRKLYGTATAGGHVFWTDVASCDGWRVQENRTIGVVGLKPFRLIDPKDHLWASADAAEELSAALPDLIEEFSAKTPLLSDEDARKALAAALRAAIKLAIKAAAR